MIERELYLKKLRSFQDADVVKVLTGVRRSGKTSVMKLFIEELKNSIGEDQILFITFESLNYRKLLNYEVFYEYVLEKVVENKKMYLFFDEIQLVEGWEKAVNSFRVDFDCDIYVTGSNASLLSGELATLIAGRYVEIPIYPLSYKEYLTFVGAAESHQDHFSQYLNFGGFPAVVLATNDDLKKSILEGIFDSIILRDVTSRANIREESKLLNVTNYLLSESGNTLSINRIANQLRTNQKNYNNNVVNRYVELLTEAFVFYKAVRYDIRGREHLETLSKYYVVDQGLRNVKLHKSFYDNIGRQIENVVYMELRRRGYTVDVGKLYEREVDFVAKKNGQVEYYQVAMELPANDNREINNLKHIKDGYAKFVLTYNKMDVGQDEGIEIVYVLDWLLQE